MYEHARRASGGPYVIAGAAWEKGREGVKRDAEGSCSFMEVSGVLICSFFFFFSLVP